MINVKNLYKNFGDNDEIKVLKGVNESIKKGEKVNVNINPEQALDAEMTLIVIANTEKLGKLN